jgi:hypothetical protein
LLEVSWWAAYWSVTRAFNLYSRSKGPHGCPRNWQSSTTSSAG